jgi:uncharacterized protein
MTRQTESVSFDSPPPSACWQHQGLRSGFEVTYFSTQGPGMRAEGTTTGFQEGDAWVVTYQLELDHAWHTRRARITARTARGSVDRRVASDGAGHWSVDGEDLAHLDGCLDIDLESSAMTNALPVRRLGLAVGESAAAPAAYVSLPGARIERLEQRYARVDDQSGLQRYDYEAPAFDFSCRLVYDHAGLPLDYPGIARRAG